MIARMLLVALALVDVGTREKPAAPKSDCLKADISGIYAVYGKEYFGAVVITKLGEVYRVQYAVSGLSTIGLGVRVGDSLAVGWTQGSAKGVTHYRISGKTLSGRWAAVSSDGKMSGRVDYELLVFLQALPAKED